jgi:hypothetical protein
VDGRQLLLGDLQLVDSDTDGLGDSHLETKDLVWRRVLRHDGPGVVLKGSVSWSVDPGLGGWLGGWLGRWMVVDNLDGAGDRIPGIGGHGWLATRDHKK